MNPSLSYIYTIYMKFGSEMMHDVVTAKSSSDACGSCDWIVPTSGQGTNQFTAGEAYSSSSYQQGVTPTSRCCTAATLSCFSTLLLYWSAYVCITAGRKTANAENVVLCSWPGSKYIHMICTSLLYEYYAWPTTPYYIHIIRSKCIR